MKMVMSALLLIKHYTFADANGNVRNFGNQTSHYTTLLADRKAHVRNFGNQHHTFANETSHRTTLLIKPALNFTLHYTFD
jgi:hypothetical protein